MWGAFGREMIDNRPLVAYFRDEEVCKVAGEKVRARNEAWARKEGVLSAPGQMGM